jgi:hypothetical protein
MSIDKERRVRDEVPLAHRRAAEEVRAHLVVLRGGAPFLSPTDAQMLHDWLREGVPCSAIIEALERAADARRRKRSRVPLTLRHARVHLGKPSAAKPLPALAASNDRSLHPLLPMAAELERLAPSDPFGWLLTDLAQDLLALPSEVPDELVTQATRRYRKFLHERWECQDPADMEGELAKAREEMAGLIERLTEAQAHQAAEEIARDRLRQAYPALTTATLWALVSE